MGDRGNIIIRDEGAPDLYLYTHWNGDGLLKVLKTALRRKQRWNDAAYLARIIFCTLVKGAEDDETGYGISTIQTDGRTELVVDVGRQTVAKMKEERAVWTESFDTFITPRKATAPSKRTGDHQHV